MENRYQHREFEQYVKQNADQYRMFPSDKVWKNINNTLHRRNRWYGIGLALLLMTTVSVTWVMLVPSNKNRQLADKLPATSASPAFTTSMMQNEPVIITPEKPSAHRGNQLKTGVTDRDENLFIAAGLPMSSDYIDDILDSQDETVTANNDPEPVIIATSLAAPQNKKTSNEIVNRQSIPPVIPSASKPVVITPVVTESVVIAEPKKEDPAAEQSKPELKNPELLTIESVVNSYTRITKRNKFSLEAYFTPTVSYRVLRENNSFISASRSAGNPSSTTLAIADVNSVVTHKPDFGLQLGVKGGYALDKRFTLIAGLQFNVNKYDIRAYNYPSETATIALMSGNTRPATVSTQATYRNYSGSKNADWLHNLYFSASMPIGLQAKLSGASKTEIGVSGTLQPTYILGNRTYILSTDYKNYVEVPSLVRKLNMNAGFEAYAAYSTGKINWKIGPQVRYQLLSSFSREYPVKEHLFDFGLKVGIMLNK